MLTQNLIIFIITSVFLINIFWHLVDLQSIFFQSIKAPNEEFSRLTTNKLMASTHYATVTNVLKKETIEPFLLKRLKRLAKTRKRRKLKIKTELYNTIETNSDVTITSIDFKKRAKVRDPVRKRAKQKKSLKAKSKIISSIPPSRTRYKRENATTGSGTTIKLSISNYPSSDYSVLYDETYTSESLNYKNLLSQQHPTSPNEDYLEEEESFDQKVLNDLYDISTDGKNNLNEIKTKRDEIFEDSTTESNEVNKETEEIRNKFITKKIRKKFYKFSATKKQFKLLRTPHDPYFSNQVVGTSPEIAFTKLKKKLQKTDVPTNMKTSVKYSLNESEDESLKSLTKEDIFRLFKALFIQENKKIEYKIQTAKSDDVTCLQDDVSHEGTGSESSEKLFKKLVKYLQKCCNNRHTLPLKNNYFDLKDLKNEKYMMCKMIDKTQQFENNY